MTPNRETFVSKSTEVIAAVSARVAATVRRSIREAKASGADAIFLTAEQDNDVYCLVFLAAGAPRPIAGEAIRSLRAVVTLMVTSGLFRWADMLGPRVALDLAKGRPGPGMLSLYADLNHHRSVVREHVIRLAWLARDHLDSTLAAERILFNVGASHGSARSGLAVLRAMCVDD